MKKVTYHVKRSRKGAKVHVEKHRFKAHPEHVKRTAHRKGAKRKGKMTFFGGISKGGFWD